MTEQIPKMTVNCDITTFLFFQNTSSCSPSPNLYIIGFACFLLLFDMFVLVVGYISGYRTQLSNLV